MVIGRERLEVRDRFFDQMCRCREMLKIFLEWKMGRYIVGIEMLVDIVFLTAVISPKLCKIVCRVQGGEERHNFYNLSARQIGRPSAELSIRHRQREPGNKSDQSVGSTSHNLLHRLLPLYDSINRP